MGQNGQNVSKQTLNFCMVKKNEPNIVVGPLLYMVIM